MVPLSKINENRASYEIIREFLDTDKDKLILNSIVAYNENFYEIRDMVFKDMYKEVCEGYT